MTTYDGHEDTRTIAVRRWMIERTRDDDGSANYAVALLLAQVTWWCSPNTRTGRLRAEHEHGGETWLVRPDSEWGDELGMSERQVRRARKRLEALGWIECRTLVDRGQRCTHLRRLPDPLAEASTIRPKAAEASGPNGQTIRPETADRPTVQADSHAGASTSSTPEVEREEHAPEARGDRPPLAERDPQLARAIEVVQDYWDWCHEEGRPRPALAAHGERNPFMALAKIVRSLLDAGHAPEVIREALPDAAVYTTNGIVVAINQQAKARGVRVADDGLTPAQRALREHRAQRTG